MVALDRWADAMAGWRQVRIDAARCLPQVSPRSRCDACAAVCPEGAITLGASPTIRECSACGLCAASCRADAIVMDNPSDEQLVQRFAALRRKFSRLSLTCGQGPAAAERAGCLGRLTPELLLAGAACGFKQIDLVAGPCASCQSAGGYSRGEEAASAAQTILQALNHPCQIRLMEARDWQPETGKQPGTGVPVQAPVYEERRAFLLSAFGLLRELLPLAPERTAPTERLLPGMSRRREILRWALAQLQADETNAAPWGEAGIRLTGRCLHCSICQRLCPNGAIAVADGTGLQLNPGLCHTCGLCTQVCPVGALSLGAPYSVGSVAAGDTTSLGTMAEFHCASCGQPVTATGEGEPHCLACTLRPKHPEVISL